MVCFSGLVDAPLVRAPTPGRALLFWDCLVSLAWAQFGKGRDVFISLLRYPRFHAKHASVDTEALFRHMSSTRILLQATQSPAPVPSSICSALEHMDTNAAKFFKVGLLSSVLGQAAWADASTASLAGALDDHSEELFRRGCEHLRTQPMPTRVDVGIWTDVDFDEVRRGQRCDVLHESFRDVLEAFQQWSGPGVEKSAADVCTYFQMFAEYLEMLDYCEWGVLVMALGWAPSVLSATCFDAVPHGDLDDETNEFLKKSRRLHFRRGPLLEQLDRIDDATERMAKIEDLCPRLADVFEKILKHMLPRIRECAQLRQGLFDEFTTVCQVLRRPGVRSTEALMADFQQEQSLVSQACRIAELRQEYKALGDISVPEFCLRAKDEEAAEEFTLLDRTELQTYLDLQLTGLALGTAIEKKYLHDGLVAVEQEWRQHSSVAFRLLEAAGALTPGVQAGDAAGVKAPPVSALQTLTTLFGKDAVAAMATQLLPRLQAGESLSAAMADLPVDKAGRMLSSIIQSMGTAGDDKLNFEWLGALPAAVAGEELRGLIVRHWLRTMTEVTGIVTLSCYLTKKYEADAASCTSSIALEEGVSGYIVDAALSAAICELQKRVKVVANNFALGATSGASTPGVSSQFDKFNLFASVWQDAFLGVVCKSLGARLHAIGQSTESMTRPDWRNFITDATFTRSLATKHLLTHTAKNALGHQTGAQHDFVESVAEHFAKWGVPKMSENPHTAGDYSNCARIYDFAQETIFVVAAVVILLETKPKEQPSQAAAVMSTQAGQSLPGALKKELNKLKNK